MALTHFYQIGNSRTACGRTSKQPSNTTNRKSETTCQKCLDALSRRAKSERELGNYDIKHDMVGTAKVLRSEEKMKISVGELRETIRNIVKESSATTWTAFVRWNGEDYTMEEIDVKAPNERIARKLAQQELDRDYQPGGEIVAIEPARLMQVWGM